VMKEDREPAASMMKEMLDQIRPAILTSPLSEKLNLATLKLYPLMWQSYVWLTYQLQEECVVCGVAENKGGESVGVLLLAERCPYKSGEHKWSIEWQPSIGVTGELTFNWTVCSLQSLKGPDELLRWCEDRLLLQRIESVGEPLLQRWLFEANWKQGVGRQLTKNELQHLLRLIPFEKEDERQKSSKKFPSDEKPTPAKQ